MEIEKQIFVIELYRIFIDSVENNFGVRFTSLKNTVLDQEALEIAIDVLEAKILSKNYVASREDIFKCIQKGFSYESFLTILKVPEIPKIKMQIFSGDGESLKIKVLPFNESIIVLEQGNDAEEAYVRNGKIFKLDILKREKIPIVAFRNNHFKFGFVPPFEKLGLKYSKEEIDVFLSCLIQNKDNLNEFESVKATYKDFIDRTEYVSGCFKITKIIDENSKFKVGDLVSKFGKLI